MRRFLLFFAVFFAAQVLTAQTKFRIGIEPDLKTYTVYMKTEVSLSFPQNVVSSGQVGLVVPRGGFLPANVANFNHGQWGLAAHYMSPEENNRFDYLVFSFSTPTSDIPFVEGGEVKLFSFENLGTCTGDPVFVENENDDFWPPNSLNAQIGNYIGVGPLQENFHKGTYYTGGYGCEHELSALCGITFNGIDFTSPTTCGASDGTLTIFATTDLGLDLVYSIDGGGTFHASNVFTGLNSGDYNVVIRDIVSICIEDVGSINVPGPLGPLVIGNDLVNPDCGMDNGSITLHARTDFGDPVEFSIDGGATFTQDSVFTGLGEGTYNFVIKNTVNLCQTLQSFTLTGCAPVECIVYYEMERLADGRYQVVMLPDTTWAAPLNITGTMQVTWRAPAGGFEIGDLQSKVPDVTFGINGVIPTPALAPGFDYFSVGLTSTGTNRINYIKGERIPLFCFSNLGDCQGGEVELIDNETDPLATDPNPTQDVKQELFTNGMGAQVPICLNENNSVPCEMTPIPCLAEFELNETMTGGYVVSMTPDVDYTGNQGRTMELIVTLKVPTGTFILGNLTDHPDVAGIELTPTTEATAPAADSGFDYINVSIGPLATPLIPYVKGQKVNLFTFENTGTCGPGTVKLYDPETDAYSSATAGLFLKAIGGGTDRLVTCLNDQSFSTDCPPVSTQRDTVYVTMTTDMDATECIASVLDLPNGAGTASLCGNGAFVTASVADNSDCVDLSPNGNFNQTDQICVVHCDAMMGTVCDTTIIIICPQVQIAPVAPACAGSDFQISTTGGAGNFTWTPNNATGMNPTVNLSASATYTVVADDGNGCSTTADVAITVNALPTPSFTFAGVCLGEETVFTNTSGSGLTYSWDFGDSQTNNVENPTHTYAANGTYTVSLTVEDGNTCVGSTTETVTIAPGGMTGSYQEFTICAGDTLDLQATGGTSYAWSPADFLSATDIANPQTIPPRSMTYLVSTSGGGGCGAVDTFQVNVNFAPVIANVVKEDVTDCDNPDGSIKIFASAGGDSLAYSIDCGVTWQGSNTFDDLDKGTYAPTVINTVTGCISVWSKNYVINGPSSARLDDVNFTNPTACGAKDASITFDSPETAALEYSIDGENWETSATFNNLEGGDYTPMIRFVGEVCTTPFSGGILTIMDGGTLPALTNDFDAAFICESSFKTVKVSIDQPIDTYQITTLGTYSDDVKTDSILSFLIAAPTDSVMVSVELTAAGGCSVTQRFMAYASELPTLAAREKEDTECQKEEGAFLLTVTGGEAPYMFDFTDPTGIVQMTNIIMTGDQPFNDLGVGDHVVAVTDNIGCISDMIVTIDMLPVDFQLTENVSMPNCGDDDGSVVLSQINDNLTFEWMNVDSQTVVSTDSAAMNLPAGDYSVLIKDGTTGCFEEKTFALMDAGTPELVVEQTMPVLCEGANNGGVSFHVTGTGEFTVSIQNEELVVLGDESRMIFGLTGGTYDLIVKNNDTGCETIEAVTIAENVIAINENSVQPTDCAATDGQVCLTLTDGKGPYDITSLLGDMMDVAEGTEVCFDNVAPGIYSFEITDDSGCEKLQNVELAAPNQPVISVDSFAVSGLICPDVLDNGSIVSVSSSVYTIEQNGAVIGMTPAMALAPGTYMLTEDVAGCKAQKEVTLVAPEAWSVDTDLQAETCDTNDGTITLTVSGANGNYTYDWTAGITATGNVATGLNADSTYSVIISDGEGCSTELNGLKIDKDCPGDNCTPIFEVENFNAEVPSSFPQICLPLVQSNISGQDVLLNGAPYGGFATVCSGAVITYDVKDLLDFATLPMNVVDWAYGSKTLDDLTFNTIAELVAEMNVRAPFGNWRYDETTQTITGEDVAFFGDIVVGHAGSTDPIMVLRNEETVLRTAIEIPGEGSHVLVVFDAMDACPDTLIITATEFFDGPDYPDSISINTAMDIVTGSICDADNLQFPVDAILSICEDPANGIVSFDGNCYQYTPAPGYIGDDVFCIEVCDGSDCQQIMVRVTVRGSEVVIHTGISPNGDFTNDALVIENLELYESAKVQIYNRWGVSVYENENYTNSDPWGGEFGEVVLPDGTYFIILDAFSADGSSERFTNYIQVVR